MEKYDAIYRTINDKIADCEKTIEYYRGEVTRIEKINSELRKENELLKEKIENLNF
jgi:predicted RNase H-like nuclease (RuvC/YqgF family)